MPIDLDNIFDLDQVWWEKASKEEALPRAFSEIKRLQVEMARLAVTGSAFKTTLLRCREIETT